MRITVHIPDHLEIMIKNIAQNEHKSVSSLVADAVTYYIHDRKRKVYGQKIFELIGKVDMSPDILNELEQERNTGR